MWIIFSILFYFFYNFANTTKVPICTGVTYTALLNNCTTNEKMFTKTFDMDVSLNGNNASFPNRLRFYNFSEWSLNDAMYYQTGPMYWRYINTVFLNPNMNQRFEIDFLDASGTFGFPFKLNQPPLSVDGPVYDKFFLMFIDQGRIFEGVKGKLFDPIKSPCFDHINGNACFAYTFAAAFLLTTTACCKTFNYVEIPDKNEGYCNEMETNAKLTDSEGVELVDFSTHYFISENKMDISVTKFNSVYNSTVYILSSNGNGNGYCNGTTSASTSNCSASFPSGNFQFDMILGLNTHDEINEFEAIISQLIFRNGRIFHDDSIPYSPTYPCHNRTTIAPFNDGLTVESSSCCSKFGTPVTPPPVPKDYCLKYNSNTTLSNNAATLQVEYYLTMDGINVAVEYWAQKFSTCYFVAFADDISSDFCVTSVEQPKANCTFDLSQTHKYELQFRTSIMPNGFNMLEIIEDNKNFVEPFLTRSNPCHVEVNQYNGNMEINATTEFCCTLFESATTILPTTPKVSESTTSMMISVETTTTSPTFLPNNSNTLWWIIGAVLVVFLSFATIIILYFLRKKYQERMFEKLQETIKTKMEMSPLEVKLSHDERLTKQIDPKNVVIDFNNILGKGSNATVYKVFIKAKFQSNLVENKLKFATEDNSHAAIKIPKSFDHDEVEQFVRELDALITLGSHSHIITFLGWTLYHDIPALVTELADKNLLQFVNSFRGEILPVKTIISILWQISQALEHLASLNMVHRDVACRNVLLTNGNVAKLADFGLCCHCDESFTYQATLHKRLPLKWLSLEALVNRVFSEKSDVWSFGVMCYEIFSYGSVPYATLSNDEMLEFLQNGNRLAKPADTPDNIYLLMLDCWKMVPSERPKFEVIGSSLRILLENETASYGYLTLGSDE